MTDEVVNFPRGGKRKESSNHDDDKEKDLFQVGNDVSPAKTRKKDVKKTEVKRKKLRRNEKRIEPLSFQKLSEDQVILGIVKDVRDHQMTVSLPNGLNGMVSIMEISSTLLKRLQQLAKADSCTDETLVTLKKLYQIGEPVPCSVISTKTEGQKRSIDLSINPTIVNKSLPLSALKTGCLIFGAVASKEEHGYTIDLGIPDIMAFLKAEPEIDDSSLVVGKCFWFSLLKDLDADVTVGESRVVNVSIAPEHVKEAKVTLQKASSVECFRPGMKVDVKITKTVSDGLQVKFMEYNGCIHKRHLPKSPASYNIGQKVEARVLYTAALTKEIHLSLLPRVVNCIGVEPQPMPMSVGDVGEWEVLHVEQNRGVYFQAQGITGFAPLSQLSDEKIENLNTTFVKNTAHRCRVIGFHPIDDVALLTLKESVINEEFLSISDVRPGQIVKCRVLQIHSSGLIVQLSKRITALVPNLHVADVPLKNIEKKFSVGDKLKCRVLKVDVEKKKILLSNKKSLVTTSQKIPTSYFDISRGDLLEGCVITIKNNGVVVSFCNDVTGWVPRSELSTEDIVHPETLFYQSQVVRCRVLSCRPEEEKLTLSLIIVGKAPLAANQKKMEDFEVGKLVEAKILKKEKHSFTLELQPSGDAAFLSKDHLSDSKDNQELLWQALKPGQIIKDLMLLKQANVVVTTLKESFISAAREGLIPKSFSGVKPGHLVPGVIKHHQNFGIFVELPGGLTGLAPLKFTMDRQVPDLTAVFTCGQSVVVKSDASQRGEPTFSVQPSNV
ncbi:protein RRP5 homolog isoform X1 [Pomacea canaliculata]|uniref:protein RRP5 homolog isoform X1 n=1 Tax=Pomacea canaliculata TaxID=400727 RepID=UPI000D7258CD|nr:protein RRP5 homolog isoform X1 [Pomacea canaliculata]